jgi:hypothetical protein
MLLFAVAHALRLRDGTYAIRSPDLPGCEVRGSQLQLVREEFSEALRDRALEMVKAGETPRLYTFEELESCFAVHCQSQVQAPDRLSGSFDTAIIVRAKLPDETARRVLAMRVTPQALLEMAATARNEDLVRNTEDLAPKSSAGAQEITNDEPLAGTWSALNEIKEIIETAEAQARTDRPGATQSATEARRLEPNPPQNGRHAGVPEQDPAEMECLNL